MVKGYALAERNHWLQIKARGKNRFIRRELLGTLLFWLILIPALEFFGNRPHSFSVRSTVFTGLIMLPIFLLGGYLEARWRWQDFEKKYPEDGLPPWQ